MDTVSKRSPRSTSSISVWIIVLILVVAIPARARGQGGPPLITDDPDTPGPGYWEINVSTLLVQTGVTRATELPRVDLNYGVGRRIQLKLEVPWLIGSSEGQAMRAGIGNATTGVKWRFIGEEGKTLAWSLYPQLEVNTTHAAVAKGLVDPGWRLMLPTEITVERWHVEINTEVGAVLVDQGPHEWLGGISTEGSPAKRLELLAELHANGLIGAPASILATAGTRLKLTRTTALMFAAGGAVRQGREDAPGLIMYAGVQWNWPGIYDFSKTDKSRVAGPRRLPKE